MVVFGECERVLTDSEVEKAKKGSEEELAALRSLTQTMLQVYQPPPLLLAKPPKSKGKQPAKKQKKA